MAAEGQTQWLLMWNCTWSKGVRLNSSVWKKWHTLTFIGACWTLMEIKQWMWAQWGSGWSVSAVTTATVGHLCWYWFLREQHAGSCSSLVKKRWWLLKMVFCSWDLLYPIMFLQSFLSVTVSMDINRRHYFWSDLHVRQNKEVVKET